MIFKLERYIKQHPRVSLAELALVFQSPVDVMSDMIDLLQAKGRLVFSQNSTHSSCSECGDCQGCAS